VGLFTLQEEVSETAGLDIPYVDETSRCSTQEGEESMSTKAAKEATITDCLPIEGMILYRVLCPECQEPQWHPAGTAECIYTCEYVFAVHPFHVVSGDKPEEEKHE
jgi:hypothetical protein